MYDKPIPVEDNIATMEAPQNPTVKLYLEELEKTIYSISGMSDDFYRVLNGCSIAKQDVIKTSNTSSDFAVIPQLDKLLSEAKEAQKTLAEIGNRIL